MNDWREKAKAWVATHGNGYAGELGGWLESALAMLDAADERMIEIARDGEKLVLEWKQSAQNELDLGTLLAIRLAKSSKYEVAGKCCWCDSRVDRFLNSRIDADHDKDCVENLGALECWYAARGYKGKVTP